MPKRYYNNFFQADSSSDFEDKQQRKTTFSLSNSPTTSEKKLT